jgi:hypothetical protein
LSDFNAISYVGRLWCPELIPDIEIFLLVAIFKAEVDYKKWLQCTSRIFLLLLPMKFIPQWSWVLSNLWYVHSPTRRHVIKNNYS